MSGRRSGKPPAGGSYQVQLRRAMSLFLPRTGLATLPGGDSRLRWTQRLLVVCAVLVAWDPGAALADRFAAARSCLVSMYPGRRRPGGTYAGFVAALARSSEALLAVVTAHLRRSVREAAQAAGACAGGCWEVAGWVVFGADGSKFDCPMTVANEEALGCSSRKKSWPQMLLTVLFHAGTGLPWAFARGGARSSERSHLLQMLDTLPPRAMLLADAGFTGYDLMMAVLGGGRSFVIRVGSNVRLLTKLGYAVREFDGLVYLWPDAKRAKGLEPLVLRLVTLTDGRNRTIHLLTDVLDAGRLSDAAAVEMYQLRWGAELLFRSLKQTLGRRKVLSDSPAHAEVELDWAAVGLWLLAMMNAQAAGAAERRSTASALRAARSAMAGRGGRLWAALSRAVLDDYRRRRPKKARHWPHKKREKPPGAPKARTATAEEVTLAMELKKRRPAA
jgi:hypothetical protein